MIIQYLRGRGNRVKGVVVAVADDNNFAVGYSLTNTKAGDRFNRSIGQKRAIGKAKKVLDIVEADERARRSLGMPEVVESVDGGVELSIADSVLEQVEFFSSRASKYFKDKKKVFKLIRKSENISETEASKLEKVFIDGDAKPAEELDFESATRPSFKNNTLLTPRGTFVSIGNETLLVHRTDGKWKVEKVS